MTLPPRGRGVEPEPTAAAPRIDPLAIVSLALNLFCGVGSVAAIVVSVMAMRKIARSNGTLAGRGIALAGLGIGIAVTLVALAPGLLPARRQGRGVGGVNVRGCSSDDRRPFGGDRRPDPCHEHHPGDDRITTSGTT